MAHAHADMRDLISVMDMSVMDKNEPGYLGVVDVVP